MIYTKYITKKRMRTRAICGTVNIPCGTVLPVVDGFIMRGADHICAVRCQNARDYFWGYADENPEREIKRQQLAEQLLKTAPMDSGDALADRRNPWNRYGSLEPVPGGWRWVWNEDEVKDLPYCQLAHLLDCIRTDHGASTAFRRMDEHLKGDL